MLQPWIVIWWPVGSGRGEGDAVEEAGHREAVTGFVLEVGEQGVAAGIAEVDRDLVDAGPQVVPPGAGFHLDVGEAGAA